MQQAQAHETYRDRSKNFLVKAREEFDAGDLEQASEKAWGAAALMVKAVAEKNGLKHRQHAFLSEVVDDLAVETNDPELDALFDRANTLHFNFYENRFGRRGVRRRLAAVERFVDKMSRILDS